MRSACLRLRAKGVRYSCQTSFTVKRDILARVILARASNMGRTSCISHGTSLLCDDSSL